MPQEEDVRDLPRSALAVLASAGVLSVACWTGSWCVHVHAQAPVNKTAPMAAADKSTAPESPTLLPPLAAAMPESPQPVVVDLPKVIAWAEAANPIIALADEQVQLRLAERLQARALLLPMLNAGANLRAHRGGLLTGEGAVRSENTQSLYGGFGADAKGGGTVAIPGVHLVAHLAEAVGAPRVAERRVASAAFDAAAARNDIAYQAARAYLILTGAQAQVAVYRQLHQEFEEVARLTANFARTGQGREADAQRVQAETQLIVAGLKRATEEEAVAAAELARLLDANPATPLRAADATPPWLTLIDPERTLAELLDSAAASHPELAARAADIGVQEARLRQERLRPWLPVVSVGFSAGEFGGGGQRITPRFGDFGGRTDFDALAVWTLENLGAGNRAVQNHVRAELAQAQALYQFALDRVRRDVAAALAQSAARRREVELARRRIDAAQRAFQQEVTRTKNLQGRVIETLNSLHQLEAARLDLIRAVVDADIAQLLLTAALGKAPAFWMAP